MSDLSQCCVCGETSRGAYVLRIEMQDPAGSGGKGDSHKAGLRLNQRVCRKCVIAVEYAVSAGVPVYAVTIDRAVVARYGSQVSMDTLL